MKKNHSPGGKRVAVRVLIYTLAAVAILGTRETLRDEGGPITRSLGVAANEALMAASKMGLGVALLHQKDPETVKAPKGMTGGRSKQQRMAGAPRGLAPEGRDTSLLGKGSRALRIASHKAFIEASKVDIYGQ